LQRGFFSNWVCGFSFAKTDQEGKELLEQACFVGSFVVFSFFVVVVVGREFINKTPWGDDEYHRVLGSIPQTRSWWRTI
jgi:hypothetical protein